MNKMLMKRWAVMACFLMVTASISAQTRIATLDLAKVFEGYWKKKQADISLKERQADLGKEHKTMVDKFKEAKEAYDKTLESAKEQAVSEEERERRKKSAENQLLKLREDEQTIVQFERQANTTLEEQGKRMRDKIVDEIQAAVSAKAKAAGHTLVIDTSAKTASLTPVVLYSKGDNDLTDEVLAHLNVNAPASLGSSSGEEKPAPAQ